MDENSLAWKIREFVGQNGFGVYLVELKDQYYFELNAGRKTVEVDTNNPEARHMLTERTISGVVRRSRDCEGNNLQLEIFRDFNAIIPYDVIKYIERLRDNPCSLPRELRNELHRRAGDIVNRGDRQE